MDEQQRKYIDDVVEVLRIGAEGKRTKREVEAEAEKGGVQHSVHMFSKRPGPALFEYSNAEKHLNEEDRHPRLNVYGLGIYLAQVRIELAEQRIEQAQRDAAEATRLATQSNKTATKAFCVACVAAVAAVIGAIGGLIGTILLVSQVCAGV